jgi:hypothetical protein
VHLVGSRPELQMSISVCPHSVVLGVVGGGDVPAKFVEIAADVIVNRKDRQLIE